MKGFGGAMLALVLTATLTAGAVFLATAPRRAQATQGWALKPVVVISSDVAEGETLALEHLSQRSIPEQFVGEWSVEPTDVALVVGRTVNFALEPGDFLVWAAVGPKEQATVLADACFAAIHPTVETERLAARKAALDGAAVAEELVAEPAPAPAIDAKGNAKLVMVTEDVAEGAVLTRAQLATTDVPAKFATPGEVPAEQLEALVGTQALAPLLKGDLVTWVQVARPDVATTAASCIFRVNRAMDEARRTAATREAKAWKPTTETP